MKFKQQGDNRVLILDEKGNEVGHIFSPSGSGENSVNAVQICGFSEAFDFWGCGIYKGFKDIQLLFDGVKMPGRETWDKCIRCFMEPCQCELKQKATFKMMDESDLKGKPDHMPKLLKQNNPFFVKREYEIKDRITYKEKWKKEMNNQEVREC